MAHLPIKMLFFYGRETNLKLSAKDIPPLQDVGEHKCLVFSVDGSELVAGGAISALKGNNVTDLLEMIMLVADMLVTSYGEIDENQYLDPRTAQVAIVDHFKQAQSGSRKEPRKAFETAKPKAVNIESHEEMPVKIHPYISKRMRRDADE